MDHNLENIHFGSMRIWSKAQVAQNIHPDAGFVVAYINIGCWVWVFGQVCGVGGGPGPLIGMTHKWIRIWIYPICDHP